MENRQKKQHHWRQERREVEPTNSPHDIVGPQVVVDPVILAEAQSKIVPSKNL
jgi:hypothetical protein